MASDRSVVLSFPGKLKLAEGSRSASAQAVGKPERPQPSRHLTHRARRLYTRAAICTPSQSCGTVQPHHGMRPTRPAALHAARSASSTSLGVKEPPLGAARQQQQIGHWRRHLARSFDQFSEEAAPQHYRMPLRRLTAQQPMDCRNLLAHVRLQSACGCSASAALRGAQRTAGA
uniref:Uncharacterized protein n=1 Tax=Macrostomum lignano TaxID=282301 RepID=A0A1I8F924_9PLAT